MAERRENSVLFSLRELRQIEDERVKQEEEAEQARLDAERKAKEEVARLAREEEERKKREEEDRVLRMQAEKERQLREEQLRLEAEKHRAQVEAAARLEEARIQADMHVKVASKKAPVGMILGIVGFVLVASGGALGYVFKVVLPEREAAVKQEEQRKTDLALNEIRNQMRDQQAQFDKQQVALRDEIAKTQDAEKRKALEAKMKENEDAARAAKERAISQAQKLTKGKKVKPGEKKLDCDPATDPLCGANL